jgi:ribosomal-protein-serine acetyltransferase
MVSIIVDDHIVLRSYTAGDADELFAAVNGSRKHLHPWLEWVDKTLKPEHSLQFIQQSLHELHNQQSLALGIFLDGKVVGGIGMHEWDHATRRAQAGYWLSKEHEGKGIIHRSFMKFLEFLFIKIGLNKVEVHFFPENERSARVAERLGFRIEGVIRQSKLRNGMPDDIVVAGLLKSEWSEKVAAA